MELPPTRPDIVAGMEARPFADGNDLLHQGKIADHTDTDGVDLDPAVIALGVWLPLAASVVAVTASAAASADRRESALALSSMPISTAGAKKPINMVKDTATNAAAAARPKARRAVGYPPPLHCGKPGRVSVEHAEQNNKVLLVLPGSSLGPPSWSDNPPRPSL